MFKKQTESTLHKIPLRITDTTLRDAHQSIWATRMRTKDIMGIIDTIDNVGYYSLECWGGATFDVCMRFLREDPWERLRLIKGSAKKTPLQMLLRGQNLVGYRNYPDDVVEKFIHLSVKNGVDIFRVFDALNDSRNLEASIKAIKKHDAYAQGTLAYTISPAHTIEKYVSDAKEQVQMGIDSLCIKDMAGILSPISAEKLVKALVKEVNIPIQIHTHSTSGMGISAYVEGVRAGAGAIDCSVSSMALNTAQPPVETLVAIFKETNYAADLDLNAVSKTANYFKNLFPKRTQKSSMEVNTIDPDILIHQIPGGMISNFRSQLTQQNALDKLDDVLKEVSAVRKDFGYPPLVTPTSQIVGTQAVLNILSGERYKIVPKEIKDYVKGMYGDSPIKMERDFVKKILGDEKPIKHRPADDIKPVLDKITDEIEPKFITQDEDILSYAIFPEVAAEFFKWRAKPEDEREMIPADVELLDGMEASMPKKSSGSKEEMAPLAHKDDYQGIGYILSQSSGMVFDEFLIKKGDFSLLLKTSGAKSSQDVNVKPVENTEQKDEASKIPSSQNKDYVWTINSPITGTFYCAPGPGKPKFVEIGQSINMGEVVCTVEAMKLFNEIKTDKDGVVASVLAKDGETVQKGQALIGMK
ncbi:MAG: pyruvate carboxylase subunit B [Chitinispirillales bacterium]|jgi:oxaloacetate decarboxylase alpha subunit|nr:pyruvate carboxylase subunit B [Chitinispirillales bacterium]